MFFTWRPLDLEFSVICALLCTLTLSAVSAEQSDADSATFLQTSIGREQTSLWNCPLPAGAKWCSVNLPGKNKKESFEIAVYASNDIVSDMICKNGVWERLHQADLGAPGHAIDIGGNIGYHTLVLAHAGWNVTTFEPVKTNVQLMQATLCRNPGMKPKIDIHNVGLGAHADKCQIISAIANRGDGMTRCGEDAKQKVPDGFELLQSFEVQRLDDILSTEVVPKVDFVKLDVEGFECQVLAGGGKLLEVYRPRLLHTEVWSKMQGCDPANYIQMFLTSGYKVASDDACMKPDTEAPTRHWKDSDIPAMKDFWICKRSSSLLQDGSTLIPPSGKHRVLFKLAS